MVWVPALLALMSGCASVPADERLLVRQDDGSVVTSTHPCNGAASVADAAAAGQALPAPVLRVASWNLHKGDDEGWQDDLRRYAGQHDLLLLQEAALMDSMREVLDSTGHRWQMTGAFAAGGREFGVLVAARAKPLAACTLRSFEPLFPIPKSAMVLRYRLAGSERVLAVANLHGINFTLGMGRFQEQLDAVAAELARHDGPIVFGGDFNTWSQARNEALHAVAARLGLASIDIKPDGRRRTFGSYLDHLLVRGLKLLRAHAPEVTSSDHNPILAELVLIQ